LKNITMEDKMFSIILLLQTKLYLLVKEHLLKVISVSVQSLQPFKSLWSLRFFFMFLKQKKSKTIKNTVDQFYCEILLQFK